MQGVVGGGDTGAPPGVVEQRLLRLGQGLRQPADRGVGGGQPDRAGLDRQLADERAHQAGLAGAVGADERGDVTGGEHQVEAGDQGAGAEGDLEVGEGEGVAVDIGGSQGVTRRTTWRWRARGRQRRSTGANDSGRTGGGRNRFAAPGRRVRLAISGTASCTTLHAGPHLGPRGHGSHTHGLPSRTSL